MATKKWFLSYEIERDSGVKTKLHTFLDGEDAEEALNDWIESRCIVFHLERENFNILQLNLV